MPLETEPRVSILPPEPPSNRVASRAEIQRIVDAIIEARAANDFEGVMAHIAPDVVCFPPSTWSYAAYPYAIRGKEAMREALRQRRIQYELLPTTVHRVLIDGDEAIVHRTRRLRERGGGPDYAFDCVNIVRFRNGLVVEFHEFPDGAGRDFINAYPH